MRDDVVDLPGDPRPLEDLLASVLTVLDLHQAQLLL